MSKMVDLGVSRKEREADLPKKYYPTISIYDKVPDELMNADLGKVFRFETLGKIVGKAEEEGAKERLTIEIHKIGLLGKAGFENKKD